MRERSSAEATVNNLERLERETADLLELLDMAEEEPELLDEIFEQLDPIDAGVRELELRRMLSDPNDDNDAILTITPGAGGVDAQDWAEMLLRMYLRWAERRGLSVELLSKQPGDEAGIKDASVLVKGEYAYGYLRAENGVHRLIRISPFDSGARRHTAFAAVSVVPDLKDDLTLESIELKDDDLEVSTMRSGGAGGQHVNRTESAIRIRHIPTGFVVRCENERSQHQNRETAMKMLRGLIFEKERREREAEFEDAFGGDKNEIGFGSQVRTYTLQPYTMVKDERTDHKMTNAESVLDGDLDGFIESWLMLSSDRREAKKKKPASDGA